MREIKFRAWDKKRDIMYEPLDLEEIYCGAFFYKLGRICLDENNFPNLIIMQYTGLKDKNGKECYEHDIIKFKDKGQELIGEINYIACSFYATVIEDSGENWDDRNLSYLSLKDIEIIDNRYEGIQQE